MERWKYCNISDTETIILSGWKLYIYGNTLENSIMIEKLTLDMIKSYNLTMKTATRSIISRNLSLNPQPVWSAGVIYLCNNIFNKCLLSNLINDINYCLRTYSEGGTIDGAGFINSKIHYRYDLNIPINPSVGIIYDKYLLSYRGEYGNYNISNNIDLCHYLK